MIASMPRPRPKYLHRQVNRHGTVTWYVRVGHGQRTRIQEPYGSPEFDAAYEAAVSGIRRSKPAPSKKGTLKWLVDQWKESGDWEQTKPATRRQRDNILLRVLETGGNEPLRHITNTAIERGMDRRSKTPAAANNYLKTMRALFKWAKKRKYVRSNPTDGTDFRSLQGTGFEPWTGEDVKRFCKRWPAGSRERLAMVLVLFTGLRRGDVVRLGWQHVTNGMITMRLEKTGNVVTIPLLPPLLSIIEQSPTGDMTFIATIDGKPRVKEGFGTWFREACRAAKVTKSAHGLRKLSAQFAAEAGASEEELMSYFGWTSIGMSQVYTRAANRARLAKQTGTKLIDGAKNDGAIPPPLFETPPPEKSTSEIKGLPWKKKRMVGAVGQ